MKSKSHRLSPRTQVIYFTDSGLFIVRNSLMNRGSLRSGSRFGSVPNHSNQLSRSVGMGDKFNESAGTELPAGSYAMMPKGVRHFAWAKGETIIDVYGLGPFGINYVNPSDDPRHKAK